MGTRSHSGEPECCHECTASPQERRRPWRAVARWLTVVLPEEVGDVADGAGDAAAGGGAGGGAGGAGAGHGPGVGGLGAAGGWDGGGRLLVLAGDGSGGAAVRPAAAPLRRRSPGRRPATAPGAPVRAAGAGRVSYAGLLAGRGVLVVVHGALRTTYEPVTAVRGPRRRRGGGRGRSDRWRPGTPGARCWPACTGDCAGARSTSTRCAWWSRVRCGCCRSAAGVPLPRRHTAGACPGSALASDAAVTAAAVTAQAAAPPADSARSPSGSSGRPEGAVLTALGAGAVLAGAALRRRS